MKLQNNKQNSLRTTAQFRRKEPRIEKNECVIEKVVEFDKFEFEDFSKALLSDYEFLIENRDSMFVDELGVTHALLVIGEGHEDGILVDSEGSSYARYSALLPNARTFLLSHEHELCYENRCEETAPDESPTLTM